MYDFTVITDDKGVVIRVYVGIDDVLPHLSEDSVAILQRQAREQAREKQEAPF